LEARAQLVSQAAQSSGHVAGQFAEAAIERDAGARQRSDLVAQGGELIEGNWLRDE
jgi:hypothetical protein